MKASYIDGNGTTESMSSSGVTGLPPAQTPPTGNVTISGILQQNQVIFAMNTLADINGLGAINYQWLSNGNAISGTVQNSYTLTQTDVGKTLSVKASYSDGLGKLESVSSQISSPVTNVNDLPKGFVYINGTPTKGQTLTAGNTLSDVDGLGTITYQWLRNGEFLFNANNPSYTLTQADADKSISVKASYLDLQGKFESVTSTGLQIAAVNQLSVNSANVNEGDGGSKELTFTLTLSKSLLQTGSVDYTLKSGSATAGIDFSSISGTLQFNPGEISKTITVPVLGDMAIESDETFNLVLSNPLILELSNGLSSMTTTGTIRNDDFPTLILSDAQSIQEGNTGQSAFTYTAKLSQVVPFDVSVDYVTQGITATAGQDFNTQSGTLKFSAGEKEKTISVQVISDTQDEADETLSIVLSNPQNAKFANSANELRSTGTILNDDSQTVRLNSPTLVEGDSGLGYLKFIVSLGYAVNSDVTFEYKTDDGTATGDTDYLVNSNTGTIVAGTTTADISIAIIGDSRIESNETIKLTINSIKGITLPANSLPITGLGTIINDDLPVVSLLATKTVYEPAVGGKRWDIPVTLNALASTDSVISYHTESGSALQEKDFANTKGQVTIAANTNSGIIYVPVLADSEQEPDETFKLIIDKVEGGAKLPEGQSSLSSEITISNLSVPELAIQNVQIAEGDSGNKNLTFKVTLSSISTLPVSFTMRTVDKTATAGQDYQATVTTINTIPVGTQSLDITVPIIGDKISESDETFGLELSKLTNAVFNNGNDIFTATGTILDDDKPIIRIDDVHVTEGNAGIHDEKIRVTLSATAALPVTIHYSSIDGTAKAGEDFIKVDNTLVIPAGAKEGYISVSIQGDTIPEAAQDFHIQLSSLINAQFLNAAATIQNTVTIDSDDADKLPIVSTTKNLAIDEGDSDITNFPITLNLSSPATDMLTVHYETLGIDAIAGSDFISTSGTVTFLAGDVSKVINISVYGDPDPESDEDFILSLTDPQGMRLSNGLPSQDLILLIRDDDAEPSQTLQGTPKNDILDATTDGAGTGDDSLDGLKGIDTMIGGDGNDTYYVDNIKDSIIEEDQAQSNAGDDDLVHSIATAYTLPVNVEHLIIDGKSKGNGTGNVLDNKLIGNLAVNVLSGLVGSDTLDGGSGNDTLTGGLGNDTFIFSSGIKGNKNIDTVKDFVHGQDKIYLSADIFSKLATAVGFKSGSEPLSLAQADSHYLVSASKVKATDASSYLLYDKATGRLSYDEDGSGKLVASSFVTLTGRPALTLDDFWFF
ncbi:MAG: Calx-beta domain-containing protein [Methylococcales bacterium]